MGGPIGDLLSELPTALLRGLHRYVQGWRGASGIKGFVPLLRNVETRFDANIEQFGGRVQKIKARSADALAKLGVERRQFDLAYIDGSHLAADVYSDAVLTWPLIVRGGLMIFDDYLLGRVAEPPRNAEARH